MKLLFRIPCWIKGKPEIYLNNEKVEMNDDSNSFARIERVWKNDDIVKLDLKMGITVNAIPGNEKLVTFNYGSLTLAGLIDQSVRLTWKPDLNGLIKIFMKDNWSIELNPPWGAWLTTEEKRTEYNGWTPMFPGSKFGGVSFVQYGKNNTDALDESTPILDIEGHVSLPEMVYISVPL